MSTYKEMIEQSIALLDKDISSAEEAIASYRVEKEIFAQLTEAEAEEYFKKMDENYEKARQLHEKISEASCAKFVKEDRVNSALKVIAAIIAIAVAVCFFIKSAPWIAMFSIACGVIAVLVIDSLMLGYSFEEPSELDAEVDKLIEERCTLIYKYKK